MSGKEIAVLGAVIAAALAVGLAVTGQALKRAEETRAAAVAELQARAEASQEAVAEEPGAGETDGTDAPGETGAPGGTGTSDGTGVPGETETSGAPGTPDGAGAPGGTGTAGAPGEDADGPSGGAGEEAGTPGGAGEGGGSAGAATAMAGVAETLESGGPVDMETLEDLGLIEGNELPSMGGGDIKLESLTAWLQAESIDGLTALAKQRATAALAAGTGGTAVDAERRAFARSQGERNYQGELNHIQESAAMLAFTYIKCRDLVPLHEENVAFLKTLTDQIKEELDAVAGRKAELENMLEALNAKLEPPEAEKEAQEETGKKTEELSDVELELLKAQIAAAESELKYIELVQGDYDTSSASLAKAELDLEGARKELEAARQALNAGVGNEVTLYIAVTDALSRDEMPSVSEEEAVRRALEERNEIRGAAFAIVRETKLLEQLRYQFPPDAPECLEQAAALHEAQAAFPEAQKEVEAAVRAQYGKLTLDVQKLDLAADALEKSGMEAPDEAYKTRKIGEEWASNASTLSAAWAAIFGNRQQLITGTADYNLGVLQFTHAISVGSTAAGI